MSAPGGEGTKPLPRIAPPDAAALAEAVCAIGGRGEAVRVEGSGSELPQGNPLRRADAVLSTLALTGIDVLDAEEGVAHVGAGTPVETLREAARREGLALPLDPPSLASTIGGALAAGAVGPRTLGFGRARDQVLGLEVVLGSGERTRCGGRVVKNVTGYDLAKLYVGSLGTLCVITHAWLRLRPLPERTCVVAAALAGAGEAAPGGGEIALMTALAAARLPGVRAAALLDAALVPELGAGLPSVARGGFLLVVELASDEPVVSQAAAALAAGHGAVAAPERTIEAVAALEGTARDARHAGSLRMRVTARPSRLPAAYALLRAAGARVVAHPGLGLLCGRFPLDPGDGAAQVEAALAAARAAARAGEGSAILAAAPAFARVGRDAFGDPPSGLSLMRRLKSELDPRGVLNPGLLVGGI